jgi:hypothetical protein
MMCPNGGSLEMADMCSRPGEKFHLWFLLIIFGDKYGLPPGHILALNLAFHSAVSLDPAHILHILIHPLKGVISVLNLDSTVQHSLYPSPDVKSKIVNNGYDCGTNTQRHQDRSARQEIVDRFAFQ